MACYIAKKEAEHAHNEGMAAIRQELIEARIVELMAGEFSPDLDENIAEALDNLNAEQIEIRTALVKFSNVNGTQIMKQWVRQYWELRAEEKAIEELS